MTGWPRGTERIVLDVTDSTNSEARRRSEAGETGPVWIQALRQAAGRGRLGRPWITENGNLAATYLFPFEGTPGEAALLSFCAALAVGDVLERLVRGASVQLKWPNDVLLNGAKASGILLESLGTLPDGKLRIAIGIGVNLRHHPPRPETNWAATSILAETGAAPAPDVVLEDLAEALADWISRFSRDGFGAIRESWLARAANLQNTIEVRLPDRTLTGRFADLDVDGALVLEGADGSVRVAAGDVYFSREGADAARD